MKQLFRGLKKNLKVFFRTKSSAAVVLLSPIIIVALVGFALYANTGQDYPLGVVSSTGENIEDMINVSMFTITKYESLEDCSTRLLMGSTAACVKVENINNTKNVSVVTDESREDVAILLQDKLRQEISLQSEAERKEIQEDRLGSIQRVYDDVNKIKSTLETIERRLGTAEENLDSVKGDTSKLSFSVDVESGEVSSEFENFVDVADSLEADFTSFVDSAKTFVNESGANQSQRQSFETEIDNAEQVLGEGFEDDVDTILDEFEDLDDNIQDAKNDADSSREAQNKIASDLENIVEDIQGVISSVQGSISTSDETLLTLETLGASSVDELASPIRFTSSTVSSSSTDYLQIAPTLISIAVFLFSGLLGGIFVYSGRMGDAAVRERSLPLSILTRFNINFFTSIFLGILQFGLLVGGLLALLQFNIPFPLEGLLTFGVLGILVSVGIGGILGSIFNSVEGVSLSILSVNALFLFFSRTFFPIDTLGVVGEYSTMLNPLSLVSEGIRRTILLDVSLLSLEVSLYILGSMIIASMFVNLFFHMNDERDSSKSQAEWIIDIRLAILSAKTPRELRDVVMDLPYYKYIRVRKYVKEWLLKREFEEAAKQSWSRKKIFG